MSIDTAGIPPLERAGSAIPGLDAIIHGGFFKGGVYIISGAPGAGKTVLGNHICFRHAENGGRVLYVTLLAESHARMLQHIAGFAFYDAEVLSRSLTYVSGFGILQEGGLRGLLDLLRREMTSHRATLLVLDGFAVAAAATPSEQELKKFIHELQTFTAMQDCLTLLLTNGFRGDYHAEQTMVDGLISLHRQSYGNRVVRELEVLKFRGSDFLVGRHSFRIGAEGITIFPRLEALLSHGPGDDRYRAHCLSMGVPELDDMLGGGLPSGTTTMLLGPSGSGKTTLGLHFLCESSPAEPGLLFGFYETPVRLQKKAERLGLSLARPLEDGTLECLWYQPTEQLLDDLGAKLLDAVRRRNVKRLFIDGLDGFKQASPNPDRLIHFLTALTNELGVLGVTTICSTETKVLVGPEVVTPVSGLSVLADNLILLRFVELRAQLYRLLSILKVRDNAFDAALREFRLTSDGIKLADTFRSAEDILSGAARLQDLGDDGLGKDKNLR